jgi:hypothetical protein
MKVNTFPRLNLDKILFPDLITKSERMTDPNYNEHLLLRGSNNKEVAKYLRKRGWLSVPRMHELAHEMSKNPKKFKALFNLLDQYHI